MLAEFSLAKVEIELRKFILKDTEFVAVKLSRDADRMTRAARICTADSEAVSEKTRVAKSFVVELVVYTLLVTVYFFPVLHFLGAWLKPLFDHERRVYAVAALALMLGQGVLLEMLTTWLLRLIRSRTD